MKKKNLMERQMKSFVIELQMKHYQTAIEKLSNANENYPMQM